VAGAGVSVAACGRALGDCGLGQVLVLARHDQLGSMGDGDHRAVASHNPAANFDGAVLQRVERLGPGFVAAEHGTRNANGKITPPIAAEIQIRRALCPIHTDHAAAHDLKRAARASENRDLQGWLGRIEAQPPDAGDIGTRKAFMGQQFGEAGAVVRQGSRTRQAAPEQLPLDPLAWPVVRGEQMAEQAAVAVLLGCGECNLHLLAKNEIGKRNAGSFFQRPAAFHGVRVACARCEDTGEPQFAPVIERDRLAVDHARYCARGTGREFARGAGRRPAFCEVGQ